MCAHLSASLSILDMNTEELKLGMKNVSLELVNTLRRVMHEDIPTMAIHTVRFLENSSVMPNDVMAHELGLIPLLSETVTDFKPKSECDCKSHCEQCSVVFILDSTQTPEYQNITNGTNQTNQTNPIITLNNQHLVHASNPHYAQQHLNVRPYDDGFPIPLNKIRPDQIVRLEAIASRGTGSEHVRWCPVTSGTTFEPIRHITLNPTSMRNLTHEQRQSFVSSCPRGVFRLSEQKTIDIEDCDRCTMCMDCVREATYQLKQPNLVKIEEHPTEYYLYVETINQHPPERILLDAFAHLDAQLYEASLAV